MQITYQQLVDQRVCLEARIWFLEEWQNGIVDARVALDRLLAEPQPHYDWIIWYAVKTQPDQIWHVVTWAFRQLRLHAPHIHYAIVNAENLDEAMRAATWSGTSLGRRLSQTIPVHPDHRDSSIYYLWSILGAVVEDRVARATLGHPGHPQAPALRLRYWQESMRECANLILADPRLGLTEQTA